MANSNKEMVFLIFVEGSTDADCLDLIVEDFKKKLDLSDITIRIQNGDIFTSTENKTKNGQTILKDQIQFYLNYSKLSPQQIIHVAFVTDTDGIFINPINYLVTPSIDGIMIFQTRKYYLKTLFRKEMLLLLDRQKLEKYLKLLKTHLKAL